jgi:hypothetical protein
VKLNKTIKTAIVEAALKKSGIPEKKLAIRKRYADWAEAVRQLYATPEQLDLIEKTREACRVVDDRLIARRFTPNRNCGLRYMNIAGQRRDVFYNGDLLYPNGDTTELERISPCSGDVTLEAEHPLTQQLFDIDHDAEALKQETEQLSVSLWAVLNSVSTDAKLVEVWPEAVAFIPAAEKANTPQLPALQIAELNKLIGLP